MMFNASFSCFFFLGLTNAWLMVAGGSASITLGIVQLFFDTAQLILRPVVHPSDYTGSTISNQQLSPSRRVCSDFKLSLCLHGRFVDLRETLKLHPSSCRFQPAGASQTSCSKPHQTTISVASVALDDLMTRNSMVKSWS